MSDGCLIEGCGRRQRAREMCEMHYGQAKRAGLGELRRKQPERASGRKLDAQQGINSNCVDCWGKPYAGGMRCLPCFQARCDARRVAHSVVQRPGTAGYAAGVPVWWVSWGCGVEAAGVTGREGSMRLLDLYCGAGMATDGYVAAGFDVSGVDLNPQPHYPSEFTQADALDILQSDIPNGYDVIHASPPCQAHTRARHLRDAQGGSSKYPDLLTPTLALLRERWAHKVWIVENVPGAPGMESAAVECGSAYMLGVRRHRLFLSNVWIESARCDHEGQGRPWGVYHVMGDRIPSGGRTARTLEHGLEVMGVGRSIPWASLKEGFPPAYTRHVGEQVMLAMGTLAA